MADRTASRGGPRKRRTRNEAPKPGLDGTGEPEVVRELYDEAPVAYVTTDRKEVIQALNNRALELLRIDRRQALGFPLLAFVAAASRDKLAAHQARLRDYGRAVGEVTLRASDDREIEVRLESQASAAQPGFFRIALFDISDRKHAAVEHTRMEVAQKVAQDANLVKDRFIAVLSHELRAPLAPLLAAVSTLEAGAVSPEKLVRLAEMIKRNVLREARLVDDLLDVSRIASGKVALQRGKVDLHAVARESLEMLAPEAVARRQSLAVELEAPLHHVDGDAHRLRQIFNNLLKNAVKFTPEGGHIAVRSWNNGDLVVVEVSDDGLGIEPQMLPRIFENFEQAHGPASAGGLGLGLAICRGMVELHGGKIAAHSPGLGRGARFLVELTTLPAEPAPLPAEPAVTRRPARRSLREHEILIVEDEPDLAEALLAVLESQGYRARAVNTAAAALAADLDHVELVISDLGLPDLDGRTLVERLKAKRDLKAIALSGYGTEADVQSSHAAGFDQHLTKPVEMETLLGAIDRVCAG